MPTMLFGVAVVGLMAIYGCKSVDTVQNSGLEATPTNSKFNVELTCKTSGDKSLSPPQQLLVTKDSAHSGGYLVVYLDAATRTKVQLFARGTIRDGNGILTFDDQSKAEFQRTGSSIVTDFDNKLLSCSRGAQASWNSVIASSLTPGNDILFACSTLGSAIVKEVNVVRSRSNQSIQINIVNRNTPANEDRISDQKYKFSSSNGSLEIELTGPGSYSGIYSEPGKGKIGMSCIGSFSLL